MAQQVFGKVYALYTDSFVNDDNEPWLYIGSTKYNRVSKRLAKHRQHYSEYQQGKRRHIASFDILEKNLYCGVIILEEGYYTSKDHLRSNENYFIDLYKNRALNKQDSYTTYEERLQKDRKYYENNREELLEKQKQYNENNKEHRLEKQRQWRENNREQIRKSRRQYRENNIEYIREKKRQYHQNNREQILEKKRERYENKREQILEKKREQVYCENCNVYIRKNKFPRHTRSNRHQSNI